MAVAALVGIPVLSVLSSLLRPSGEVWRHLWQTQLLELVLNTLFLLAGVGAGTLVLGVTLAWLVVQYEFPGRAAFEWALILPLAVPAYVLGFVFLGFYDYSGPVQAAARAWLGGDLRLPTPRSWWGVTLTMTLVFYPYVYLLARVAFREHGATTLEAARSLGRTRTRALFEVVLPMARPSLAAGMALAMMEALADFGTVATFGYRTLTEAVYRVWYGMFDREAATQVASVLLLMALGLLILERASRGRARFTQFERRGPGIVRQRLRGWRGAVPTAVCLAVLGAAFLLPVAQLAWWAVAAARGGSVTSRLPQLVGNTLLLAGSAAAVTCLLATLLAYACRLQPTVLVRAATRLAGMGYALPGAVIAVGVLTCLAGLDRAVLAFLDRLTGTGRETGLLLTGSAVGLVIAYVVRFMAVGLQPVEATLAKIPPSLDDAARSLGSGTGETLARIHLPLLRGGLLTALVLAFVEVMKEMPATLLLRPLGFDTLTVEVWLRTSESMWEEAALPALAIVVAGLIPVTLAIRWSAGRR
ncbi:MAG TPA: iron ABC transporter permease [Candidatus Binatia bacterium]|nr:iron ABC transporter permease [Candidatus Binatia bacterium]